MPSKEKFFDVSGQVVKLQMGHEAIGVANSRAAFYCKIRLDR
jgi:hypothetical protein